MWADHGTLLPLLLSTGFALFFFDLLLITARSYRLFLPKTARWHRVLGATYLAWLLLGFVDLHYKLLPRILFDAGLGVLGTFLTLTAAWGFPHHRKVKNEASGTLDAGATVTYSEMIEHSFYQGLNLLQILYLHIVEEMSSWRLNSQFEGKLARVMLALAVTSPWFIRSSFPVNRFSDNYIRKHGRPKTEAAERKGVGVWLIPLLYRLKKYQYVFYKHFLLHGLNLSVALADAGFNIVTKKYFKWYWLGLNTAYVMEFFLQTLVKRKKLSQSHMLGMQQLLMLVCTCATLPVLGHIRIPLALLSLILNFLRRGHDVQNTMFVIVVGWAWDRIIW